MTTDSCTAASGRAHSSSGEQLHELQSGPGRKHPVDRPGVEEPETRAGLSCGLLEPLYGRRGGFAGAAKATLRSCSAVQLELQGAVVQLRAVSSCVVPTGCCLQATCARKIGKWLQSTAGAAAGAAAAAAAGPHTTGCAPAPRSALLRGCWRGCACSCAAGHEGGEGRRRLGRRAQGGSEARREGGWRGRRAGSERACGMVEIYSFPDLGVCLRENTVRLDKALSNERGGFCAPLVHATGRS